MNTHIRNGVLCLVFVASVSVGSCSNEQPTNAEPRIDFQHPLAPPGLSNIYVDGQPAAFADNFDYAEYYAGEPMTDEFSYYVDRGFHSVFNLDLNADTEYLSLMILNAEPRVGFYTVQDSAVAEVASISYRLSDTMTNIQKQVVESGSLQITKFDTVAARVSGVFRVRVRTKNGSTVHTIEGSFTDVYLKYGEDGGEVMSADISGTAWHSAFDSGEFYHAFGNSHSQGVDERYFSIQMSTPEDTTTGYESFSMLIPKPVTAGNYDLEPGRVVYRKFMYDRNMARYALAFSDTNDAVLPHALSVSDMDTVRRRLSGSFAFSMHDGSGRSPISVRAGTFRHLYWW
ncbi:MAG: hypothetical protein JSS75_03675 [Bacteroidetes bacterium]|nr:hypothetical protein [Bacteroidota bacterium]